MRLLLVGCGAMGSALLQGWIHTESPFQEIVVISPHLENADQFQSDSRITFFHDVNEILSPVWDLVLFAVKPQVLTKILGDYRRFVSPQTLFVSIAAALPLSQIQQDLGENARCARLMPNTPVVINQGVCGLLMPQGTPQEHAQLETWFSSLGDVIWVHSDQEVDRVTAVSGCGPAYVFHMIEALAAAAEGIGFTPGQALSLAKGTLWGAANYAHNTSKSPQELRVAVTSPGGMTEAALSILMGPEGLEKLMKQSLQAALDRSEEIRAHGPKA